jgi:hypothetical protein
MQDQIEAMPDDSSRSLPAAESRQQATRSRVVWAIAFVALLAAVVALIVSRGRNGDEVANATTSRSADAKADSAASQAEDASFAAEKEGTFAASDATSLVILEDAVAKIESDASSNPVPLPQWEQDIFNGKVTLGEYVISGRAVMPDRIGQLFDSDRYERMMDTLRAYPGDAEMAHDYSTLVRASLKASLGRGNSVRYACSDRLCMVTVYSNQSPPLDVKKWFASFQELNNGLATTYVHDNQIARAGGFRIRMLFAVDPRAVNLPLPAKPGG